MSSGLNWREIDAVLAELELAGSFIRDVRQPVHHELVFELYAPRRRSFWLLVSFDARHTRLHRLAQRPRQLGDPQRFVTFMRAHVRGGRIRAAGQVGGERIIKLVVACAGAEVVIWLRLWANAANCVVTEPHGQILDALFRRPKRGEISGGDYHPERDLQDLRARRGRQDGEPEVRGFGNPADPYNVQVEEYFAGLETAEQAQRERQLAARERTEAEQRTRRLVRRLGRERAAAADHERLQELGQLLLTNLARVEPGAHWVRVADYHTGAEVQIELAPNLTPAENAQDYFRRAKRARSRHAAAEERLRLAEQELARLQATDPEPGPAARPAGAASRPGGAEGAGRSAGVSAPPQRRTSDGALVLTSGAFTVLVGRTARQNDAVLRQARGNDYWLHCRDYPGAHVFVRHLGSKSVPLETLLDAANLALFFSKARAAGQADVYYTQVKHLRRPRTRGHAAAGSGPGRVIATRERNLFIKLDQARIDRLLAQDD